jgi:hypothetical protein
MARERKFIPLDPEENSGVNAPKKPIVEDEKPKKKLLQELDYESLYGRCRPEQLIVYNQTVFSPYILEVRLPTESGRGNDKKAISEEYIESLVVAAQARADSQNDFGIRSGFYPKGRIIHFPKQYFAGRKAKAYTYKPEHQLAGLDTSDRDYESKGIGLTEYAVKELFPKTPALINLAKTLHTPGKSNNVDDVSSTYAQAVFTHICGRDAKPKGRITTAEVANLPVIIVEEIEDLFALIPYHNSILPKNVETLSYVLSPGSRGRGGIFEDTPLVIARKGTSEETVKQHIRTQLLYRKGHPDEHRYPILYTESLKTLKQKMQQSVMAFVLSFVLKNSQDIDWESSNFSVLFESKSSALITSRDQITYGIRKLIWEKNSFFYIGDYLSALGVAFNDDLVNMTENDAANKTVDAFKIIKEVTKKRPSREFQLFVAAYLSFFPLENWEKASSRLLGWAGLNSFVATLNIPKIYKE